MIALADKAARDRIRDDLETTLVVEAAAGTGKTTALVGRILSLVRSGRTNLARIVAVTFTEKAAGEMKIRLRTEIERARGTATGEEAEALEQALRELEAARIGTIHGLCRDLLRSDPSRPGSIRCSRSPPSPRRRRCSARRSSGGSPRSWPTRRRGSVA